MFKIYRTGLQGKSQDDLEYGIAPEHRIVNRLPGYFPRKVVALSYKFCIAQRNCSKTNHHNLMIFINKNDILRNNVGPSMQH